MFSTDPVIIDLKKVGVQHLMPAFVAQTAKYEVHAVAETLAYELTAYVLSQHVADLRQEVTIDIPASWWQHFKRDRAPKWFVRRYPVKTATMRKVFYLDRFRTYPDANYALPQETFGKSVMFETIDQSTWEPVDNADV